MVIVLNPPKQDLAYDIPFYCSLLGSLNLVENSWSF